jgi:hypothetical protein
VANHTTYRTGLGALARTYHFFPWASTVSGVTGWASGYLQLPSLSAQIPANPNLGQGGIEFCQNGGSAGPLSCLNETPTPRECFSIALGLGSALAGGAESVLPVTNVPLEPAVLVGPSTLKSGKSAIYKFTTNARAIHAGIATYFCVGTGSPCDGSSRPPAAAGTVFYNGYPWDAFPGQFIKVSNVLINGMPAGNPNQAPTITPGSTYTATETVTNPEPKGSTFKIELQGFGPLGQVFSPGKVILAPGHSATFSFTGTALAGAQDVMIYTQGLDHGTGGPPSGAFAGGFAPAYYHGGPVPAGLKVSHEMVQGINGQWAPASSAPGPDAGLPAPGPAGIGLPSYKGQVTLTNTSNSTITHITGSTAGESCWVFGLCTKYGVTITPDDKSVDPTSPCQFAATLSVAGVAPDGSIEVSGSACSKTTINEFLTPTFSLVASQSQPTVVTVSSQAGPQPASGPTPPTPGNKDYRPLQFPLHGLQGPLQSAGGAIGSNAFAIPAFSGPPSPTINAAVGGSNSQGIANYQCTPPGPCPPIAGEPGWNQFVASASVVQVGLPTGVPPGFVFSTP